MFFVCPSRSHIIISKTRDQMWSSLKLFNGHVRMASDVSSDKHILLWHQIAPELYCVLCSVVYWPLYKSTESAWQGRVVGRSQNLAGQQIFFFIRRKKFLLLWLSESERGGGHESPRTSPFSDSPSMAGGWGFSPLSVRSYGKYAAAGDISEQPSFLSDDVSIYNSQNACLCSHRIFFFFECSLSFFSAWGIGNHQTIGCVISKYKVPLLDVVKVCLIDF